MKKNEFIILVDMDDVLENLQKAWIKRLNEKFNYNVDWTEITEWKVEKYYPELTREEVLSPLFEDNFWNTVQPKKDAIEILNKLYFEDFLIYLVTSSAHETLTNKFTQALYPYFPFFDEDHIIICNYKQLIKGHVLIDDGTHNLTGNYPVVPEYKKILFTANPNRYFNTIGTDITRVSNWYEIYSIIERMFEEENELENSTRKKSETNQAL